ncbi:MAG: IS4 family transposase [Rudanella sp.]|nr:IS4 family transposase [Rudanella sp.]
MGANKAQTKSFYRFLNNQAVGLNEVIKNHIADYQLDQHKGHLLCINDTSEMNFTSHQGRLKNDTLGLVGNNKDTGFFLHPTLVMDAETDQFLGFSSLQIWTRSPHKLDKNARKYPTLPITEKESFKWIKAMTDSSEQLANARMITVIADRESDLYEEFQRIPTPKTQLLIRSGQNRKLYGSDKMLYQTLEGQPIAGSYELIIPADVSRKQAKRIAVMCVKFCAVALKKPALLKEGKDFVSLYAVQAQELHPPAGVVPICWRLLTTHEVHDLDQARQMVNFYKLRWWIEQLFRVLKSQGLNVEGSELEDGESLKKLCVYALPTALKVMQLVASRSDVNTPIQTVFSADEQVCLAAVLPTVNGCSDKSKNPHSPEHLAWATWIIARLGGWDGQPSQRPAGMITMYRGVLRFNSLFEGWMLLYKDVGTR